MTHVSFRSDRDLQCAGKSLVNRFVDRALFILVVLFPASLGLAQSVIYTVAGGGSTSSTSASPGWVTGAAADASGNLFLAVSDANIAIRWDAATGAITTVVGTGAAGYNGDGISATTAQLNAPLGIALDSSGNLYIADSGNNRVRMVSNGMITTVAGNGVPGDSGNGGPATSARVSPVSVVLNSTGDLYISEGLPSNGVNFSNIRKVSNGVITAVGSVDQGNVIAVDSSGNVFCIWISANEVEELSNGLLTAVAGGNGAGYGGDGGPAISAKLNGPLSVATDASGNLYIADAGNNRIRRVSAGIISTVAGDGTVGFSGDGGAALGAELASPSLVTVDSSGNIYIVDSGNQRIRKVSNGLISTIIGNGATGSGGDGNPAISVELSLAPSVAVDGSGNLYFAEVGAERVRKVSGGTITTVAGTGTQGYSGDNGPATSAQLSGPLGLAVDAAGNLYIADTGNDRIRKESNGTITTVAGNGTEGYTGDGGPATSAQLKHPVAVAADSAGNLYIADTGNQVVRKVSNGVITTIAGKCVSFFCSGDAPDSGPAASGQLNGPVGLALDSAGSVYVADAANSGIRKISNGVMTTVAGTPHGSAQNGFVQRGYSGDGGPATSAQMNYPVAIAVDASGNLYIADALNQRIRKVSNGVINTVVGNGTAGFVGDGGAPLSAELAYPSGVAVDASGNIYIADAGNKRIRVVGLAPFSLSSNPTSLTITPPGGNKTATITAVPTAGFSGIVTLSCTVAYNGQGSATDPPTCQFGSSQLSFTPPANGSTMLTVSTTPAQQARAPYGPRGGWKWRTGSLALLLVFLSAPAVRRGGQGRRLLLAMTIVAVALMPSCGGGSSGGGGGQLVGGTTPGNYAITITAASGGYSTNTVVSLTVQ
jgi:sugar lactone lactonase YvrE